MQARDKNAHCGYCGAPFTVSAWPRTCQGCGNTSYRNPVPVAVLLLPVDDGVLVIRRALSGVGHGKLALPGGFVDIGETWQEAATRELFEEAGVRVSPGDVSDARARSGTGGIVLLFGIGPRLRRADLPVFAPNEEVSERTVVTAPTELAFPLHTEALRAYFDHRDAR